MKCLQHTQERINEPKHTNKEISIIGVSVKEGQKKTGVEEAPNRFREGGLLNALKEYGWAVKDFGNLTKESMMEDIERELEDEEEYKYVLPNIEVLGVMNQKLSQLANARSQEKNFVLTLGGDHGLATGSISGMLETYPNLKVIWVDAHGDCNIPEISPSGNYHGMPVAHLLGWIPKGSMKSFNWLTPKLKPENIVYIGLRDLDKGEKVLLEKHSIKFYTPFDIEDVGGIGKVMEEALDYLQANDSDQNPIHISWDVDGCDPSFMPATGTKSRCGLTERESHFILQRTQRTGNLVSLDMVEINPELEPNNQQREVLHGDNKLLKGTPSVVYALEFILSAIGFSWRY